MNGEHGEQVKKYEVTCLSPHICGMEGQRGEVGTVHPQSLEFSHWCITLGWPTLSQPLDSTPEAGLTEKNLPLPGLECILCPSGHQMYLPEYPGETSLVQWIWHGYKILMSGALSSWPHALEEWERGPREVNWNSIYSFIAKAKSARIQLSPKIGGIWTEYPTG